MICHDKRTVYQNYRTASEQSGTGEACDESESYADSTGILRVSALSFMLFTDKNPWLWRAILVPAVSSWDFPLSGKSSMRQDRMKNLTCRRYWKKTQKENHFQAGMYFLFYYCDDDFL